MNILFIEDEKELAATGVAQLELKGYTVFPAYDIAEAQALLEEPDRHMHFVITDHRLPDGMGIQFVIEMRQKYPRSKYAVVSGCLTNQDIDTLEEEKIPYYHKPLLYGKIIDELRRMGASAAPERVETEAAAESPAEAQTPQEANAEAELPKAKKGFRFWPFK